MNCIETIKAEYAPYHTVQAFEHAFNCYMRDAVSALRAKHDYRGIEEQAWDRGLEAASRVQRQQRLMSHDDPNIDDIAPPSKPRSSNNFTEDNKMSQVTNHPTKESALVVVDALNAADDLRPYCQAGEPWSYSVVQNAGGHWIVQIHDENDEFVGTL